MINAKEKAYLEENKHKAFVTTKELNVDEYLELVGEFGFMQKIIIGLFCVLTVPSTYQTLIMTFIANNPSWKCTTNSTECQFVGVIDKSNAHFKERCGMGRSAWTYMEPKEFSIVTEWDLICEKDYISYLTNSAMFIGWGIGAVLFGWLSDKYGRKITLYLPLAIFMLLSFAMAFSHNVWLFFILRLFIGINRAGIGLTLFVLPSELVGPKYRSIAGAILFIAFTVGLCLMSLQAWLVPNWRMLLMITSVPYIILLPTYFFVPESVRWLRLNGRLDQAEDILRSLARRNKKPWPNAKLSIPPGNGETISAKFLFTPKKMAISTLIQCCMWFVIAQVYYGISLASNNFGGSMYRNFVLTSIVDIPGNLTAMLILNKFGRRPSICGSMIISGLSCIGVAFIPSTGVYNWVRVGMGMLGKLFITLSFAGIYVWSSEMYPTVIRSQGMGLLIVISRIGAASAPWIAQYLGYVNKHLPFIVMGSLTLIGAGVSLKLKETAGMTMPETLEDAIDNDKKIVPGAIIENEFVKENIELKDVA